MSAVGRRLPLILVILASPLEKKGHQQGHFDPTACVCYKALRLSTIQTPSLLAPRHRREKCNFVTIFDGGMVIGHFLVDGDQYFGFSAKSAVEGLTAIAEQGDDAVDAVAVYAKFDLFG